MKTGVLESDVFAVPRAVQPAIIAARLTLSVSPLPNLTLGPNSPPDGFYEWRREETGKSRHRSPNKEICLRRTVGLMAKCGTRRHAAHFHYHSTTPNALLKSIHNRGLVIYDREVGQQWLDPKCAVNSLMIRAAILQPLPLELMEALMMF